VRLDVGSFVLQWATGGLAFLWVTTRRREVGLGYGWLLRITFGVLAAVALVVYLADDDGSTAARVVTIAGTAGVVAGAGIALAVSVARRSAGVARREAERERRRERVAAMLPDAALGDTDVAPAGAEFPPALDLVAPIAGIVALFGVADLVGGGYALSLSRLLAGAALMGAVSDAMLLGHWYLVQPGLRRAPLTQLVLATALVWPVQVAVYLVSPGMLQVLDGSIDDGTNGLLGWIWLACAVATIALVGVTWAALRERYYSAVMSATGLLYLAILTAFGQDLIARAVLAP
jgi:hypothetical protein